MCRCGREDEDWDLLLVQITMMEAELDADYNFTPLLYLSLKSQSAVLKQSNWGLLGGFETDPMLTTTSLHLVTMGTGLIEFN